MEERTKLFEVSYQFIVEGQRKLVDGGLSLISEETSLSKILTEGFEK